MKKDVEAFRIFVQKHPKLISEVRSNNRTWRDVYEDWYFLGANHESWKAFKAEKDQDTVKTGHFRGLKERKQKQEPESAEEQSKKEITVGDVFSMFRDINVSEIQQHIVQFSGAIEGIHQLLKQFQGSKSVQGPPSNSKDSYFSVFKD
ncbi:YlbD family protein [Fictibacillus sp. KIGAM418]|uniref:YlbD family protein n=1 Tax=Fictibacillus marinisediminis TaxID=2878389 RepID=A0A9X2BCT4_9BACL|nr:YlbD family protein [Fictibacillus marinisediminis]MCK6256886.1 YlbD family protein [Fictibacillus marinisediminis]